MKFIDRRFKNAIEHSGIIWLIMMIGIYAFC